MTVGESERRADVRVAVRLRAVAFGVAGAPAGIEMVTRDLSVGGALCDSPAVVPLGLPVHLRLDLTDASGAPHPVIVEALVLRVEGDGPAVLAFHFVSASPRIRQVIKSYIAKHLGRRP